MCPLVLLPEVPRARLRLGRYRRCRPTRLVTFPPLTPRVLPPLALLLLTRLPRALLTVRVTLLAVLPLVSRLPPWVPLWSSHRMRRVMSLMDTRRTCPLLVLLLSSPLMRLVRYQLARRPTFRPLRPACLRRSRLMRLGMPRLVVRLGSL